MKSFSQPNRFLYLFLISAFLVVSNSHAQINLNSNLNESFLSSLPENIQKDIEASLIDTDEY